MFTEQALPMAWRSLTANTALFFQAINPTTKKAMQLHGLFFYLYRRLVAKLP
ncbi:hypothetical protein [Larsenimonas suaedae]|uniref:Uncharacterized protein n=1 Tax=Larsenimonas suaedae TaxID=1851019 RepID=A0ABU1GV79_9GAMM|nr:hypothetical protein [Larsenimonas suaedae]MCM2971231.1 hypothetical protein [Larsenimonas suaedae]MDR5895940.1 hypothetical protein [Larsenimonas suaedae]